MKFIIESAWNNIDPYVEDIQKEFNIEVIKYGHKYHESSYGIINLNTLSGLLKFRDIVKHEIIIWQTTNELLTKHKIKNTIMIYDNCIE